MQYELMGAAFYDAQHYVSAWREDINGETRWFFHDGMVPLRNGMGRKDMRSIRSNQSSQGIAIELLSDKVPLPAGKNPELMVYKKTSSLQIDLPWTDDEEENVRFSNDGMDDPDLKLTPISAGEYISASMQIELADNFVCRGRKCRFRCNTKTKKNKISNSSRSSS